ncbi:MAG TPA: glycoside hydrolase family 15 protein [Candidatus Eisenbacteria bacterium]|nr:glycoside hydrolase family 15 protein [Candidatus Eisenbacteria bacterium]
MASRIEDYALIGDCHTAALVGRNGSIDWLCFPRFDGGACFAALLGTEEHGRWLIAPADQNYRVRRRYRDGTLILETDYETAEGEVTLIDCMPPRSREPDVVRIVVGRRGQVRMRMQLIVRFDYGSIIPWVRRIEGGIRAVAGPDTLILRSGVDLSNENFRTEAEFTVSETERVPFVLMWHPSHEPAPPIADGEEILAGTEQWWREWSSRCTYEGPWKETVVRSLITLKALTYAPTGGIVAAATTSLPEHLGGVRNWDYRYCWVRDATFTLYALMLGGYIEEACAWREWLLRAVAGKPSQLNIMYGLAGERRLPEIELGWLPGYEGSSPVRTGNAACYQFQLDVYGELMDAMHLARRGGLDPDENAWRVERALMDHLESAWNEPDNGIWEVRGPKRHFTHSKVMAWVAVDRMIKAVERFGLEGPVERWRKLRSVIHDEVCRLGFDHERNTFVQYYGGKELDASLLMIPLVGFLPASDPRVRGTVEAIERGLMAEGFVLRYRTSPEIDALPPGEAAFLACTFWLADNYWLLGRHEDARRLFERLLSLCNDVGLLSEGYDPADRRLLGNFPQALSHLALVNTACNLSQVRGPARDRQHS